MLDMDQGVVEEWLSEFKTLPETAIPSYAAGLKDKASLVSALYRVIQEPQSELLEPVCHQLFEFYRSGDVSLQRFTLQFLPEFIWSYLSTCTSRDLHSTGCREALLLGIYNLEIVDKDGQSKVLSFTVPSLSKPSVYHEPSTIGSLTLTEGALAKHGLSRVVYSGPHPQREIFTAQNRISICGYPRQLLRKYKGVSNRMAVSSEFLVQLITSLYYALQKNSKPEFSYYEWVYWLLVEVAIHACVRQSFKFILRTAYSIVVKGGYHICRGFCPYVMLAFLDAHTEIDSITFLLSSSLLDSSENSIDIPDSAALSVPEISVTGVLGERVGNGETQRSRGEGENYVKHSNELSVHLIAITFLLSSSLLDSSENSIDIPDSAALSVPEINAVDLTSPEELMEISEMDEGFCSRAASNASPPVIIISSSSGKTPGKSQRKSGSSRAGKEREASVESCRDHLSRKQAQRAMSENLELLSLKRLTLTTSHSLPKPGSLSLARTATAVFSRSFEQVSNVFGANNPVSTGNTASTEANRYSACSLQEEKLAYVSERTELLGPSSRHKQRSPSIGIQLSTDL
ncbi:UNVERIFIED_CONTAM: hypothetical protein FKN15_000403 [Acipenser sinensis]